MGLFLAWFFGGCCWFCGGFLGGLFGFGFVLGWEFFWGGRGRCVVSLNYRFKKALMAAVNQAIQLRGCNCEITELKWLPVPERGSRLPSRFL